ncbi:MAG: UDP-N-acetylmuramate--L-alanine ligase [Cyclobacteriaceae bacterium]|nr:UDP-N-acetylmuramate--L-alanine ligase [Cyclobacteriaceae bacterium]
MKLENYDIVFFIGVGGIGMSALARWFNQNGYSVCGYDRVATPLTTQLEQEGVCIHFDDDVENIPENVLNMKANTLVVYTPAVPAEHKELQYLTERGYAVFKRSEVLGILTHGLFTVAVAGTHGKTTTSAMIAHLLRVGGVRVSAFLGGISTNYSSNYISAADSKGKLTVVVEADEYDRSFHTLHPNIAVITSVDADHLDIYGDKDELQNSFKDFIKQIIKKGKLIINEKISALTTDKTDVSITTYGNNRGQFFASNISMKNGFFNFDLYAENLTLKSLKLGVPGFYNVENAVAAIAVALECGVKPDLVRQALESFKGVKRRFEYIIQTPDLIYIDDYAHHPEEINAFLSSLRLMYPGKKITVVFQPHLYSRTRDFAMEFGKSLGHADRVILLDIYPAREQPLEGVTAEIIFKNVDAPDKSHWSKEELLEKIADEKVEVVATIGAGDIDQLVGLLKSKLTGKK